MAVTEDKLQRPRFLRGPIGLILVALAAVMVLVLCWALWVGHSRAAGRQDSGNLKNIVSELAAHPVEFTRNGITGGVGVVLAGNPNTGRPTVMGVKAGSPAEKAGLRQGDVIIEVNGVATAGQSLKQVVDEIRGFSFGSVQITVLRDQTNRLQFTISRNSMNSLNQKTNMVP